LILTAARTSEVINMRGEEIDFQNAIWVVPANRMKAGREHRVPLSPDAVALLKRMTPNLGQYVFPGLNLSAPLSNMAMLKTIERMNDENERKGLPRYADPMVGGADVTTHGFRATFKTWASEQTAFPKEVIEAALAHISGDKLEAAYLRGTMIEKRRLLMHAWAKYCAFSVALAAGEVVAMRRRGGFLRGSAVSG
jgi:integrase